MPRPPDSVDGSRKTHQISGVALPRKVPPLRTSETDILIVPDHGGLDPDHWQARWQAKLSTARLVMPSSMRLEAWTQTLVDALAGANRPVMFVAYALGAAAVVQSATRLAGGAVRGAFLVAPPSEEALARIEGVDSAFKTYPRDPLPFPSVVVASRSAPAATYEEIEDLAYAWGSRILDAGQSGSLDTQSGHGPWPEGLMSFASFIKQL